MRQKDIEMNDMTEETVRADVRAWLEANWKPDLGLVEWRNMLVESGWGAPLSFRGSVSRAASAPIKAARPIPISTKAASMPGALAR